MILVICMVVIYLTIAIFAMRKFHKYLTRKTHFRGFEESTCVTCHQPFYRQIGSLAYNCHHCGSDKC